MRTRGRTITLVHPSTWPLTVRVPAVVVLLMLIVSAVISERVLSRLVETQNRHLTELTGAYLDGISSAVLPHVLREDVWEIYDVLDRAARQYTGLDVVWTTVVDNDGTIIASSQPRVHSTQEVLPASLQPPSPASSSISIDESSGFSTFRRDLVHQGRAVGAVHGQVRIQTLIAERWAVLMTLIFTNVGLTIALAAIGYLMIRRMVRPVGLLSDHMQVDPGRAVRPIPEHLLGPETSEFGRLFRRYNALVETVHERERWLETLAEEERLAALGRLSSVMAHEINNPIGGMLNAVQTLRRHGHRDDVRESSIKLVERGLVGIRNVVRSALATYRPDTDHEMLTPEHLDDLAVLIRPEVRRKGLELHWTNSLAEPFCVPAQPIRDATLNLLLNACAASAPGAALGFDARSTSSELKIRVSDEGPGLPKNLREWLEAGLPEKPPFEGQGGLGLWIVRRLVVDLSGTITVEPGRANGTRIVLTIPAQAHLSAAPIPRLSNVTLAGTQELSHVTRRPLDRADRGRSNNGRKPLADA